MNTIIILAGVFILKQMGNFLIMDCNGVAKSAQLAKSTGGYEDISPILKWGILQKTLGHSLRLAFWITTFSVFLLGTVN